MVNSTAAKHLSGKTILLTGGTGSFGQKFTEIALQHNPKEIRILSRGEFLQSEMERKFNDPRLRFLIGDVRDKGRLWRAMQGVDIVVHAAALKHIPKVEDNVLEGMKTNTIGSANIIESSIDARVSKAILISTDKAAHPNTTYGMQKGLAERIFIQGNIYGKSRFSVVRYGNVLLSSGSVANIFREQSKKGFITITDERMTRYWLTLKTAVNFVIDSLEMMKGGEIFVPKISSMKITDFAKAIAPNCKHIIIGIRPGEKLHEVLVTEDESRHTIELEDRYIIEPECPFWTETFHTNFVLPEGFCYSSNNNKQLLTKAELKEMIHGLVA